MQVRTTGLESGKYDSRFPDTLPANVYLVAGETPLQCYPMDLAVAGPVHGHRFPAAPAVDGIRGEPIDRSKESSPAMANSGKEAP